MTGACSMAPLGAPCLAAPKAVNILGGVASPFTQTVTFSSRSQPCAAASNVRSYQDSVLHCHRAISINMHLELGRYIFILSTEAS